MITSIERQEIKAGIHFRLCGNISPDLHGDINMDLCGNISPDLHGNISPYLRGNISGLYGRISSDLRGDIGCFRVDIGGGKYPGLFLLLAEADEISRLDAVRDIVLAKNERLNMSVWHSSEWNKHHSPDEERTCTSSHCIAGWLQALSHDHAIRSMPAEQAGYLLAPASAHMFFESSSTVLQWLMRREYASVHDSD